MDCQVPGVEGLKAHPPNMGIWPPPARVWAFGPDGARSWRGLMIPEPGAQAPTAPWGCVPAFPPDSTRGYMPVVPERLAGSIVQIQS